MKTLTYILKKKSLVLAFLWILAQGSSVAQTTIDNAILLNGTNSNVSFGNINIPVSSAITIMAWVKWNVNPATGNKWANMITCSTSSNGDAGRFWLQHNSDNSRFEFAINTTTGRSYIFSTTQPVVNTWYHIACVYDGAKMKIYVNGVLETSSNKTGLIVPHNSTYMMHLGQWANSGNTYRRFNGEMDRVCIWDRALDPGEITYYRCDTTCSGAVGLVAGWKMDETSGSTVYDSGPNHFDGTLNTTGLISTTRPSCNPLPVEFAGFSASTHNNVVELYWETASETNNDKFIIERSENAIDFYPLGEVSGSGTTNTLHTYSYSDVAAGAGNWYYRIKQVDFDGAFDYSQIVAVSKVSERFITVYPNPANAGDYVSIGGLNSEDVVRVFSVTGAECSLEHLEKGIYIVNVNGTFTEKLIVR